MHSKRARLIAIFLILEVLVLVALVWSGWRASVHRAEAEVHRVLAYNAPMLAASISQALQAGDERAVAAILEPGVRSGRYKYLLVRDAERDVTIASGAEAFQPTPAVDVSMESALERGSYRALAPLERNGKRIGSLYMGLSLAPQAASIETNLREDTFNAAIALGLSVLFVLVIIRPLARRLGSLQRTADRIATGDYSLELPEADSDEIGQLARSFAAMAEQVRTREDRLRLTLKRLEEADAVKTLIANGLDAERSRLVSLLSAMRFGVAFVDSEGRIAFANPSYAATWSIAPDRELTGADALEVLGEARDAIAGVGALRKRLSALLNSQKGLGTLEASLHSGRLLKVQVCPVVDSQERVRGSVIIVEDVTQERESEKRMAFLAERDALTGLHNRRSFERHLASCVEAAQRQNGRVGLLLFDLDEFKSVNDLFGHRMGDAMLQQVAHDISTQLRSTEFFARIGGDEFALVLTRAEPDEVSQVADRVIALMGGLSVSLDDARLSLTCSLGVAACPDHATDPELLIAHADAAMYQAKDAGKNTWRLYRADHVATLRQRSVVTYGERVRDALRHDAIEVHVQGVFDAGSRARSHSEALLRILDENTGRALPTGDLIAAAEKSSLIVDLDRWMINAVIELLAADPDQAPIAVNISGRSFDDQRMAQYIANRLRECGVDPARLYAEITETAAIRDIREAQRFIDALHQTGCKVCLDDFGAGFATFAYIKHLPVDVLKIDGLFIRKLPDSPENQVLVKGMVDIARGLGKLTIAEAVEDEQTLDILAGYGVDMVQGFALERPARLEKKSPANNASMLVEASR